ncbi:MAG: hypothetical protein J2P57_01715 [Acidimicrobiaceae bacterium]|nr:hypothetical protein [Acidimicrobiaceae bacterium]
MYSILVSRRLSSSVISCRARAGRWLWVEGVLLALLDQYTDDVDRAAEKIGTFFDHLRQVGIRGLVAERLHDGNYVGLPRLPDDLAQPKNANKDRR